MTVLAAHLLALPSQLALCKNRIDLKKDPRPRFTPAFRILWVVLSKLLDGWEELSQLMQPATVNKWPATAFQFYWRWKSRKKIGKPTPYPGFIAYSALANILGISDYLGQYRDNGLSFAGVFSTPQGNVLAAWSDVPGEFAFPTEKKTVRLADLFGQETVLIAKDGCVRVSVGPQAKYLIDIGDAIRPKITGEVRKRGELQKRTPSSIVLMGYSDLETDSERGCCKIPTNSSAFKFTVEIYNFDEKTPCKGSIR